MGQVTDVTESGHPLGKSKEEIRLLRAENNRALIEVDSGSYRFKSKDAFKTEAAAR